MSCSVLLAIASFPLVVDVFQELGQLPPFACCMLHRKSLPTGRQQEPQGGGAKRRPLEAAPKAPPCCLPFVKDFLCFCYISGAHSGSILVFPPFFWEGLFHLPCPSQVGFVFHNSDFHNYAFPTKVSGDMRRVSGHLSPLGLFYQ